MKDLFEEKPLNKVLKTSLKQGPLLRKITRLRYQEQVNELVKYLDEGARVLDLGCGGAYISALIKHKRPDLEVIGLDMPSKKHPLWKTVKKYYDIKIDMGSALDIPYKDESFDAVLSFGVMEHIVDFKGEKLRDKSKRNTKKEAEMEEEYLSEVRRVLKKGGTFFICNLPTRLAVNEKFAELAWGGGHYRKYWKREALTMLSKKKFHIIKAKREYFLPAQFYLVSKLLDKFANKHYWLMFLLDNILMFTPLRLFAESFLIVAKK